MFESELVDLTQPRWLPPEDDPCPDAPAPAALVLDWAEDEPTLAAVGLLAGLDPQAMSEVERARYLAVLGRLEAQLAGARMAAVAAVAGPEPVTEEQRREDFADLAVSVALGVSAPAATRMVHAARQLRQLPGTAAALARGELSYLAALTVVEGCYGLAPELLPRFEELVLARAAGRAPGQVRVLVRKTLARIDQAALARAERAARAQTDVRVEPDTNGTSTLLATHVPTVDAAVIQAGLDAYARSAKARGDERTLGQLRAAALTDWACAYLTAPGAPRCHGRPVSVQVTVDLPTFLGLADHPAEVTGGGMIPAHVAREAVTDARLRRLLTDPATGALLDYGRRTYRVPADLAAAVAARYVTATSPHATAPARAGDQDHDQPYGRGGTTSPDNLHPPTRRWHRAKTRGRWRTRLDPTTGSITWTSPTGQTTRVEPHDYRLGP